MKLWTTTVEYGASGEGETLMAWIGHAEDAVEAKAELIKYAGLHAKDFAKRIGRVETLGRVSTGELADYARHFFGMNKPRLLPDR